MTLPQTQEKPLSGTWGSKLKLMLKRLTAKSQQKLWFERVMARFSMNCPTAAYSSTALGSVKLSPQGVCLVQSADYLQQMNLSPSQAA